MSAELVLYLVALLAGAFSVLTPCVLVMLPVVLGVASGGGRRRAWGIVAGLEVSFIGIVVLAGAAISALGLPETTLEWGAAAIIALFGVVLLVPRLRHAFETAASRAVARVPRLQSMGAGDPDSGFWGGFGGGLGLGLAWTPCSGPILAAVIAASNTEGFGTTTVIVALAYGAGMFFPLLAVMFGGQRLVQAIRARVGGRRVDVVMGSVMVLMAVAIGSGSVTSFNKNVAERIDLSSTPIAGLEGDALERQRDAGLSEADRESGEGEGRPSEAFLEARGYPESEGELQRLGPAPGLAGIRGWHNTPGDEPLEAEDLEGKVVLYDFWTYSCINCIRTLPYLQRWQDKYADEGLVIVGVHTPEFEFEKDEGNVADAIDDLDVTWPVATDPEWETWRNFHNRYWPAKYLVGRDGEIRYVHYGEGQYDVTEQHIRTLLDLGALEEAPPEPEAVAYGDNTPETYLGYGRAERSQYASTIPGSDRIVAPDEVATYALPRPTSPDAGLERDQYAFSGAWRVEEERSVAGEDGAMLAIRYGAKKVFLVLAPPPGGGSATVTVRDDGDGGEAGEREIVVDEEKLYVLRDADESAEGTIVLELDEGVAAYAFTFG